MNKILFVLISFFPVLVHAHQQHGVTLLENIRHVFTNPEHVWPVALAAFLIVLIRWIYVRS